MVKLNVSLSLEQFIDVRTALNSRIVELERVSKEFEGNSTFFGEFQRQVDSLRCVLNSFDKTAQF